MTNREPRAHAIHFSIDKRRYETMEESLTVMQLLRDYAKEDPTQTTLVEMREGNPIKHPNPDEVLRLHDGDAFVVYHNSPTPVS